MTEDVNAARPLADAIKNTIESERPDHVLAVDLIPTRQEVSNAVVLVEADYSGTLPQSYDYIILKAESGHTMLVSFTSDVFDARVKPATDALDVFTQSSPTPVDEDDVVVGLNPSVFEDVDEIFEDVDEREKDEPFQINSSLTDDDEDEEDDDWDDEDDEDEEDADDEGDEENEEESNTSFSVRIPIVAEPGVTVEDLAEKMTDRVAEEFDYFECEVIVRGFDFTDTTKIVDGKAMFTVVVDISGPDVSPDEMNCREVVRLKRVLTEVFNSN